MRWLCALGSGVFLCAVGCAASTDETETTRGQSSLLTAQPATSSAVPPAAPLAALNAAARLHPTGRREPTAEEQKQELARAKRVVDVKPTRLALDRVQQSNAGKTARLAPPEVSAPGDDLIATKASVGATAARAPASTPGVPAGATRATCGLPTTRSTT
jgi:hypothetical protein